MASMIPREFWNDIIDFAPPGTTQVTGRAVGQNATLFGGVQGDSPEQSLDSFQQEPGGVPSVTGFNSRAMFPSLAGQDEDRAGEAYMRNMVKSRQAYAEKMSLTDPEAAGIAYADIDTMTRGYRGLMSSGWGAKDAAYAVGVAGSVFGSFANVEDNARYLKRFAENRGTDIASAGHEFDALRKNFGAVYASHYGLTRAVSPDSAHAENISNDFSRLVTAMGAVEDRYGWQFNRATYMDVAKRAAKIAADLAVSGHTVEDIGAENVVRYALMKNGSLRDGRLEDNPVAGLLKHQARDRSIISLFGEGTPDNLKQPFRAETDRRGNPLDAGDFGLTRSLRQAFYAHRVRSAREGREGGANDFGDVSALRADVVSALQMFSTSSASVSDRTFGMFADRIVESVKGDRPTAVMDIARELATDPSLSEDQAAALGRWTRSLFMDSAEGQRRMEEIAAPFIANYAADAGLGLRDPLVAAFSSRTMSLLRKRFLAERAAVGLDGAEGELSDQAVWDGIKEDFGRFTSVFSEIAAKKRARTAATAAATAAAREAVKDE